MTSVAPAVEQAAPRCCGLAGRLDPATLDALDAALRAGVPYRVARERAGLSPDANAAVYRHRSHVLPPAAEQPGATAEQPEASGPGPPVPAVWIPPPPPPAELTARRIEDIAGLITLGKWHGRQNVVFLARHWSVPEEEVLRIFRMAASVCRANRGALSAQAETSVGVVRELRDDARAAAEEHKRAKRAAFERKDYPAADAAQRLWAASAKAALDAQKHLDAITLGRGPAKPVQVNVSVTADASFAAAWAVVRRVLDARHPGAAETVETALAVWEDRGEEGVGEWLAEEDAVGRVEH